MRAITYDRFGAAADVLQFHDVPTPEPMAGEVLVRVRMSGVNPSDIKARAGTRPGVTKPPFPRIIPHSDGAGVIEAVGAGVDPSRVGQRVWIWNGQWQRAFGTAAEYIALPSDQAVPLPEGTSFAEGAILGIPGMTAVQTVLGNGPVAGQTILVSGGAGTVGHLAVQVAVASGARVFATARGAAGCAAAKEAGAEQVFDYSAPDLAEQVLEASGGALMDRIVEVEFGANAETNARLIAERGTIAAYGSAKDMAPVMPFYPLMFKAVRLELVLVYLLSTEQRAQCISDLASLLERKALNLRVADILPLSDCAKAHDIVASGQRAGAVLLEV